MADDVVSEGGAAASPAAPAGVASGDALAAAQALDDRRLKWQCRRGMLELDLLLLPFVEQRFWNLSAPDQAIFRSFLAEDDPTLFEWFNGRNLPADAASLRLIAMIRGKV